MRRFVGYIVVVIATLAVLLVLWELRGALLLLMLALAAAAPTRGPVNFLVARGLSQTLAVLLTYLLGVVLLAGLALILGGPVLRDLQGATDLFDRVYRQITTTWPGGTPFQQMVSQRLPPPQALYDALVGEQGMGLMLSVVGAASGVLGSLANIAIILMLSLYWTLYRAQFERQFIALLAVSQRRRVREVWWELEHQVGRYILSEVLQSLIAVLLLAIGYAVMGLNFPALLALIGALLWLIPWLGAGLAVVLPLLAGVSAGPVLAVIAPVYTIAVLAFLELIVQPRIFDRRPYSSLLIVILLVPLVETYGLLGLLLAPPLAAAIQTLFVSLRQPTPAVVAPESLGIEVNALVQQVTQVQARIAAQDSPPPPAVLSLLTRLTNLTEQASRLFEAEDALPASAPHGPPNDSPA